MLHGFKFCEGMYKVKYKRITVHEKHEVGL
jgi:hypothetical protein